MSATQRYLVVSDLHLADVEDHPDGWKYYKGSRYVPDQALAELFSGFVEDAAPGDELTLVLNGDIFDFDLVTAVPEVAPFKVDLRERRRCLRATPERSVWKLARILADHPVFVGALADLLAGGHRVIYVLGNHDREFHFPAVKEQLLNAVRAAGVARGRDPSGWEIRFEPWFYYVPGKIYVEHGQQYDDYTAFRHILSPTIHVGSGEQIALPMGNLSNRYLMTKMGFFNPHSSDYILNLYRYVAHWVHHYAFSRRSLALNWFFGSLLVLARLLRSKKKALRRPPGDEDRHRELAERFDLRPSELARLAELQHKPITNRLFRMMREFWIDRLVIAVLMAAGTVLLALLPIPLWIKLMVPLSTFPLVYLLYEQLARGEDIFQVEKVIPRVAGQIADLLNVPVVTFGHSHVPRLLPLAAGVSFVDTGTWAPITEGRESAELRRGYRNYLLVTYENDLQHVQLDAWIRDWPDA